MSFISSYFSRTGNKKEEKDQEAVLDAERKAIDTYFHRLEASLLKLPQSQDNSLQRHIRDIVFENFSKEEESTIK